MAFLVEINDGNDSICCNEFRYNDTVMDIKRYYCNNINNNISINNIILYYMSQPMNDNKNIKFYDDNINFKFSCTLSHKTFGGAEQKSESKSNVYKIGVAINGRKRVISERNKSKLKITNQACAVYGDTGTNVIMPCGCVYCPQACFEVGHNTFANNRRNTKIFCAMKCKKEWPFNYWMKAACLYKDEYKALSRELQKRLMPEIKKCPNCNGPNEKPKGLNMRRVACICKKGDWCWHCGKRWIGGGFTVCGNPKCKTAWINKFLKECPSKSLGASYGDIIVPTFRACIKCHTLIEHTSACKHMKCGKCNSNFCFSCLKVPDANGQWPCKAYNFKCPAASRQVLK